MSLLHCFPAARRAGTGCGPDEPHAGLPLLLLLFLLLLLLCCAGGCGSQQGSERYLHSPDVESQGQECKAICPHQHKVETQRTLPLVFHARPGLEVAFLMASLMEERP